MINDHYSGLLKVTIWKKILNIITFLTENLKRYLKYFSFLIIH